MNSTTGQKNGQAIFGELGEKVGLVSGIYTATNIGETIRKIQGYTETDKNRSFGEVGRWQIFLSVVKTQEAMLSRTLDD